MTGFGEARAAEDGVSYRVEIRSVNNRYFKSAIKLPDSMVRFETEIDRLLRARMGRGSISYTLRLRDERPAAAYSVKNDHRRGVRRSIETDRGGCVGPGRARCGATAGDSGGVAAADV